MVINTHNVLSRLKKVETYLLVVLLIATAFLRLYDLGYSDYHGDEHKTFIQPAQGESVVTFLLNQRKGPVQFFVSEIPHLFTRDYRNELAERLPYSLISIGDVFVFYALVKKITKSKSAAMASAFLLSFNGFFVGFGRIAQYQNLNLLFSFLAIYYFHDLSDYEGHSLSYLTKRALAGTIMFCLSFLSHWDAVYIAPLIAIYLIKFLLNKNIIKKVKVRVLTLSLIASLVVLLPFMIPYSYFQYVNQANRDYFNRRVEAGVSDPTYYKFLIDLYNPFITFWFLSVLGVIGALRVRKSYPYVVWFAFTFTVFLIFFRKPGTHIYNFVLPVIVLCGLAVDLFIKYLPRCLKVVFSVGIALFIAFFGYQSYRYFVDTSREYPWQEKSLYDFPKNFKPRDLNKLQYKIYTILSTPTPTYSIDQKLPLFGFPHSRYWNEINDYVNAQNAKNGESFGYITNEDKVISDWYMNAKYRANNGFYMIGIKYPTTFVNDMSFAQFSKRTRVKEFGTTEAVVRIYRVEVENSLK